MSPVTYQSQKLLHLSFFFFALQIGLTSKTASVRDLFAREDLGQFTNFFSAKVNPSGVVMVKLSPVKDAFF